MIKYHETTFNKCIAQTHTVYKRCEIKFLRMQSRFISQLQQIISFEQKKFYKYFHKIIIINSAFIQIFALGET